MPAPASLAIKPFFILSRLCEARASPRRHLSVACRVTATSFRLAALFVNHTGRVKVWIPAPVRTVELQPCRIPGSEDPQGEGTDVPAGWAGSTMACASGKGQVESHACAWYFNHFSSLLQFSFHRWEQGKLQTEIKWQLVSYNTGKGKLYLSKEIRRNFITEWMYHVDTVNNLCLRPFCLLL